ncbi:hypothetical protein BKA66DRAFT_567893 [Pyrenochaeta sp. MPI-SDFR-AT-0127]|nr:hypothetical protein BKA66DRAFT_567893 [Pyrenochaeta sp. MPI-SDFR-AT-0127]
MIFISIAVALAAGLVSAAPKVPGSDLPLSDLVWTGPVVPNGPNVTFTGTAESVLNEILKINPEYAPEEHYVAGGVGKKSSIEKRNKDGIICNIPGRFSGDTIWSRAFEQYQYLNGLGGACGVQANSCVRISCSWGSGVHLCNDNNYFIQPNCRYLASYALDILNECTTWVNEDWAVGYVNGQEFDTDRYNVIVSSSNC